MFQLEAVCVMLSVGNGSIGKCEVRIWRKPVPAVCSHSLDEMMVY